MKLSYIAMLLLIVSAVAAARAEPPLDSPSDELPDTGETQVGPWNLADLQNIVPPVDWNRQDQPVHSLTYAGEAFQGRPTEVFAFYASPITLGEQNVGAKFPGVVLIHGGGGTAFADWA